MIRKSIIVIVGCLLLSCNRQPKYVCNNIQDKFDLTYSSYGIEDYSIEQIDSFEFSKGSIKINYTDSDIPSGYELRYDCFFETSDLDANPLLYLRPCNHPFLKYIVAYFKYPYDESVTYSIGKIYYKDHIIDRLLPDSIQKKYNNVAFDVNDLLCIQDAAIRYYDSLYQLNAEWRAFKHESKREDIYGFRKGEQYYPAVLKAYPTLKNRRTTYVWQCFNPYAGVGISLYESMESARNYPTHILKDGRRINNVEYFSNRYTQEEIEGEKRISDTVQISDLCVTISISSNPYKLVY